MVYRNGTRTKSVQQAANPDFEQRLEAWGAYYRRRYSRGSSPIAEVCQQLAIAHGRPIRDGYREVSARPEIDEADAQFIEWCWCHLWPSQDDPLRALLRAHYVLAKDMRLTCRVLRIRFWSYEATRVEAVRRFEALIARHTDPAGNAALGWKIG